jgi:DNA topoisomerase-1
MRRIGGWTVKLVVTEKNNAAQRIAELLGTKKPVSDEVFKIPVYRFESEGNDCVAIGLRGHILEPDFVPFLKYGKRKGWQGVTADGEIVEANIPDSLATPPWKSKRKPYTEDGLALSSWKMEALPYLIYAPIEKLPKEKAIIRALKNLAKKADEIIIATDFDREGELIGSDALGCIKEVNDTAPVSRARYSALTKPEIEHAFTHLVPLDENLAQAGESRRNIDLIWGAVLTRYLTTVKFGGYGNVRSSGRVQTPTLALIVAKERERMAFVPEDYWVITADFQHGADSFKATHATARFSSQQAADEAMAHIEGAKTGTVREVTKKRNRKKPPTPFNTTGLMAAAAAEGLSPARTMNLAESLYMGGYTSYPRVDNTVYPKSFDLEAMVKTLSAVPAYAPYCKKLLAKGKLTATRGKKEETDHPPIVPVQAADPDKLSPAEWKLYNLIARRFLATLSDEAVVENTKVTVDVNGEPFVARGNVLVQPGYRGIYPYDSRKDAVLPQLEQGDVVDFKGAKCEQKQTQPPARYSQGTLVQKMEELGLGTKATRHTTIDRLYAVKYVQNDPIEPSQLGIAVCDALGRFAPQITSPDMTAELERDMNDIADGKKTRQEVVDISRDILSKVMVDELIPHKEEVKDALGEAVAADAYVGKCPKCGKDLQLRASQKTHSMFIGCAGWPDCDVTYPLPKGKVEATDKLCETCGMPMIKVTPFRSKPHLQCIDPNCPTNVEPDLEVGTCPTCAAKGLDKKLIASKNPRTLKRYIRCENYDECGTSYPLPQYGELFATEETCPDCGAPMVVVKTNRGPWKLCPNFNCPGKEREKEQKAKRGSRSKRGSRGSKAGRSSSATSSARTSSSKTKAAGE